MFQTLLLVALVAAPAAAQGSKGVVSVTAAGPAATVPAGSTFDVTITLQVKAGYHINAQKPTEDYLVGTELTLSPPEGVTVAKIAYPRAQMATFEFSETPLAVYSGTAKIVATLKTAATLAAGTVTVNGKVKFQACNDQACLPPSTVDVSATAAITAPEAAKKATLALAGAPPEARVSVDGRGVGRTDAQGRLVTRDLEPGRRRVRVELDGYEPWEQQVSLDADKSAAVTVSMSAAPGAPPAPAPDPVVSAVDAAPESVPPPAREPANDAGGSGLIYGIGAGVVALAAAAAVLLLRR